MTKRQVVIDALKFRTPAYVPWEWGPTIDCGTAAQYLGTDDLGPFLDGHFVVRASILGRGRTLATDV